MIEYQPYADAEAVAQAVADAMAVAILEHIGDRSICHVALPGGTTPARCLELIALKKLPWRQIHWYLGDERCLPRGDANRNDVMIERCLWSKIDVPADNRHPIMAEQGARRAAQAYAECIRAIGKLDIVLLGMGEDGHTASLFPGNAALDNTGAVVAVDHAPKPPAERVSLGLATLREAGERHVIVTGAGKHEAMCRIKEGARLPVTRIGEAYWYIDEAASCR